MLDALGESPTKPSRDDFRFGSAIARIAQNFCTFFTRAFPTHCVAQVAFRARPRHRTDEPRHCFVACPHGETSVRSSVWGICAY